MSNGVWSSPVYSGAELNEWRYTSTLPYVFMAWCVVKHRNAFDVIELMWFCCNLAAAFLCRVLVLSKQFWREVRDVLCFLLLHEQAVGLSVCQRLSWCFSQPTFGKGSVVNFWNVGHSHFSQFSDSFDRKLKMPQGPRRIWIFLSINCPANTKKKNYVLLNTVQIK